MTEGPSRTQKDGHLEDSSVLPKQIVQDHKPIFFFTVQ